MALFGRMRAWNYSAETARSAVKVSPEQVQRVVIRPAGDAGVGVRLSRLTCRAADRPAQPEMTHKRDIQPRAGGDHFSSMLPLCKLVTSGLEKGASHRHPKRSQSLEAFRSLKTIVGVQPAGFGKFGGGRASLG